MNLCLFSKNSDLKSYIDKSGYFDNVIFISNFVLSNMDNNLNYDIVLIDDNVININNIVANDFSIFNNKKVFYIISQVTNKQAVDNIISLCKVYNIIPISPKLTYKQIIDKIVTYVFPNNNFNKNIISIIGTESKVGTTMISTSIAEILSKQTNAKVCLLNLSGQRGTDYVKDEPNLGIDFIKANLVNKLLTKEELTNNFIIKNNFYVLAGIDNILDVRHYQPEDIEYLIQLISQICNIIVIDCGNLQQIDFSGCLSICGLNSSTYKYLVATQLNSSFNSFKKASEQILKLLDIKSQDFLLLINKYYKQSGLLTAEQLCSKYNSILGGTIPFLEYKGWESDIEHKTLLADPDFNSEIDNICKIVSEQMNIMYVQKQVKKSLFDSIIRRL